MIVTKLKPNHQKSKHHVKTDVKTDVKSGGIMSSEQVKVDDTNDGDKNVNNQIILKGFKHQVGGRASIYYYDRKTLCKPYVSRELYFYSNIPPQLYSFIPKFKGLITVHLFHEDDMQLTAYALPRTLLEPGSSKLKSIIEQPKTHSKRCIKKMDQLQTTICTMESTVCVGVASMSIDEMNSLVVVDSQQSTESVDSQITDSSEERKSWSTKVLMDAWSKSKLGNGENFTGKPIKKQFMLLKNITCGYQLPCILDLKVGTCIRNNEKLLKIDSMSTRIQLGLRLSGMQMYDRDKENYIYLNKYDGEKLSVDQLRSILQQYFNNTNNKNIDAHHTSLLDDAIKNLTNLQLAIKTITNRRFYSCSILLVYEGKPPTTKHHHEGKPPTTKHHHEGKPPTTKHHHEGKPPTTKPHHQRCKVKMIDFAHYCMDDEQSHPGVDTGLLFGITNLLSLLQSFHK